MDPKELPNLMELFELWVQDGEFSPDAKDAVHSAAQELKEALADPVTDPGTGVVPVPRRPLNTLRHILIRETGQTTADWDCIDPQGFLDGSRRTVFPGTFAYLEDIRSPFNVGSLFRSAESFGMEGLYLSPLCADPQHPRSLRSAMGCEAIVPWERRTLEELPGPVFALETGGVPLEQFSFPQRGTMIVGSEELGVSPRGLALADHSGGRVSITTYGAKGSLNVGVAFGIVAQAWARNLASKRTNPTDR
jgi:TrmH family RNA methyltransferase